MRCISLFIGLTVGITAGSLGIAKAASFWFRPDPVVFQSATPVPASPTIVEDKKDDVLPPPMSSGDPQDDAGGPPPMNDHGPENVLPPGMPPH